MGVANHGLRVRLYPINQRPSRPYSAVVDKRFHGNVVALCLYFQLAIREISDIPNHAQLLSFSVNKIPKSNTLNPSAYNNTLTFHLLTLAITINKVLTKIG